MLKSRRIFPPGGFRFSEERTGWRSSPGRTFDETAIEIQRHRLSNPRFKDKWNTDLDAIKEELDLYTCNRISWHPEYCIPPDESKKAARLLQERRGASAVAVAAKKVASGIGILIDWLGSGAKPVPAALAESRAKTCSDCPQNQLTDLTSFFTNPASYLIRRQIELRSQMKLQTAYDEKLHVCRACACPMKLKVWVPIEHTAGRMTAEARAALDPRCWIQSEEAK